VHGVNTAKDDIACGLLNDQLMIITTGEKDLVNQNSWNARPVFHLHVMNRGVDFSQWVDKSKLFAHKSVQDEGPAAFDHRDSTLYFSTAECYGKATGNRLKIYATRLTNKGWSAPELLPFCTADADYTHPAFDAERNLLVFSSSMSGGVGGMDIWYTYKTDQGWSQPVNLGSGVNTTSNELFPTLHNGDIYFSSNAPGGRGGMDVYRANGKQQWKTSLRLEEPINSNRDDMLLYFLNNERMLLTSNRAGGKGGDDIYLIEKNPEDFERHQFTARLTADDKPLNGVEVKITNAWNEEVLNAATGLDGIIPIERLLLNRQYKVQLGKIDPSLYTSCVITIYDSEQRVVKEIRFNAFGFAVLELLPFNFKEVNLLAAEDGSVLPMAEESSSVLNLKIEGQLFKELPGDIGKGEPITILDHNGVPTAIAFTNETGKFRFTDVKPQLEYRFRLSENSEARNVLVTERGEKITLPVLSAEVKYNRLKLEDAIELVNEFNEVIYVSPQDIFVINRIYYDYNSARLTPESRMQLDNLDILVKKNDKLRIEMRSHTDSRGSSEFNMRLSEQRANSAIQYLASKGVSRNRFKAMGFGESQLLNECEDDVPCLEPEHSINRRTEIRLFEDQ
jgi:outer membrane protein OmpA-like peptidoglycan-associated protein